LLGLELGMKVALGTELGTELAVGLGVVSITITGPVGLEGVTNVTDNSVQ
jgi:hypothetical protein